MKMTEAQDDAYDKKNGVKENSKADMKMDAKFGAPSDRIQNHVGAEAVARKAPHKAIGRGKVNMGKGGAMKAAGSATKAHFNHTAKMPKKV